MSNKLKIYSTLKSGKVFFDGSTVRSKEIGSIEAVLHPTITNRIIIRSLVDFKIGSETEYRVFFGKLNIDRIQNEAGQQLTSAPFNYDRDQVLAYVTEQITKPIITEYFEYNPTTDRLVAQKDIQVDKNGFFLGEKHKMSSGSSNIYFQDLDNKANSYSVKGEVLDQSLAGNQVAGAGVTKPKSRIFGDYQSVPLGGTPVNDTAIPYDGSNYFPFNISGVGITTRSAEVIPANQQLKYEITVNGISVYTQFLIHDGIAVNEDITWYFEHPVDTELGTTLRATIYKVEVIGNQETILGILNVCEGNATPTRYQTNVLSRFFEDEEIALKSDVDQLLSGSTYKGAYNGATAFPTLPTGTDVLGDFYRVTAAGGGYATGDILVFNGGIAGDLTDYDHIAEANATQSDIKNSALKVHDIYVKAGYAGPVQDGSVLYPYSDLTTAVGSANDMDSIYLEGTFEIVGEIILPVDKSLFFYGADDAIVQFTNYSDGNGSLFYFNGTDNTKQLKFNNITFKNAGGYGLYTKKTAKVEVNDCVFTNNGWNGTALNTVASKDVTALLGYDSTAAELQAFYASANASNGGAMRIEESTQVLILSNTVSQNLRGIRVQDCGIGGGGVISRNQSSQNIESGIYIAAGALGGCQNITTTINVSSYNANNGLLVIGGLNNKFSQNEVLGNWNAGFCAWGAGNTTLRDSGLYDNNRSAFNGIGNTGDAKASIQINEAYNLLGTSISLNPAFRFIAEILDTQVHYTGLGSNTEKIGFLITEAVGLLPANDKNIIKIDDVGFIGQDYAIDFSEVNLNNLKVSLGDNSYASIGEKAVKSPLAGDFFELPFSNHTTDINYADISVDNTGSVIINEGVGGNRLNPYKVNDLQAVAFGTKIKVILKGSDKIQFTVPVAGCSIDGTFVNSVLNQAIVQLNLVFTNTVGFAAGNSVVDTFTLVGDDLTIALADGTSYTVDVTSLGVDENNFVSSGVLNGTNLVLSMDDATQVTVDASGLGLDENDVIVSGEFSGSDLILTLSDASTVTIDASTLSTGTSLNVVSGSVVGDDIILVMSDGTSITIDAANMINGSALTAVNDEWFISYGASANQAVGQSISDGTLIGGVALNFQGPYYYGQALTRGSEFKFNFQHSGGYNFIFGIWDGLEEATQFGSSSTYLGQLATSNWSTGFRYQGGFLSSNNTSLTNSNSGGKYVLSNGTPLVLRFGLDGHLTLFDTSGATEVEILTTQAALSVNEFNVQMGVWANGQFFNTIISESGWEIVHDFDGSENGIFDGIKDHTVLRRLLSIVPGEKFMFDLDRLGSNETFGTLYSGAASGAGSAEEQIVNEFTYAPNEGVAPGTAWTVDTSATNYFLAGGGIPSWRVGGSQAKQGMFSLRYLSDNSLELWSETENELIATSLLAADGLALGFYMGADESMTYNEIPTVTKQSITQGTQPNDLYKATVADQSVSVEEQYAVNYQIVSSNNIVNQFVLVDAPSWLTVNQTTGIVSGTAPAYAGSGVDVIAVNAKAGNAIGGTVDFVLTVSVVSYGSTNTKSLQFGGGSKFLQAPASGVAGALARSSSNGQGASDAWTISMWVKPSTASNFQTIFYYGGDDIINEGRIEISQTSTNTILFKYGSASNHMTAFGINQYPWNQWNHVMISYDGGATTNTQAEFSEYMSERFTFSINGVNGFNNIAHANYGYVGNIIADKFRIGRLMGTPAGNDNYLLGGNMDQLAIWSSDQRANLTTIYNGGETQDLSLLAEAPQHFYEMEDSVTTITDSIGGADLTGFGFTASDLVSDTPS